MVLGGVASFKGGARWGGVVWCGCGGAEWWWCGNFRVVVWWYAYGGLTYGGVVRDGVER